MTIESNPQTGLEEIDRNHDEELLNALTDWEAVKNERLEAMDSPAYKRVGELKDQLDEAAEEVKRLCGEDLEDGTVIRCGPFSVTGEMLKAAPVEFVRKARFRTSIKRTD